MLENALDAFWTVIADAYPEVKFGDMGPGDDAALISGAEEAVKTWLYWNHPDSNSGADWAREGDRFQLRRDVERYPYFIAPKGAKGTITTITSGEVFLRMDDHLPGAEEWDNEVAWADLQEFGDDATRIDR